jgi:hypothetical protein
MSYSYTVPFNGNHSSIVIGKKGRCITSLQAEFGVQIKAMKALPGTPLPYFLIEGDERQVHMAALRVFSLLSQSQARSEKQLRADNAEMATMLDDLDQENDELKVAQFGPKSPISTPVVEPAKQKKKKMVVKTKSSPQEEPEGWSGPFKLMYLSEYVGTDGKPSAFPQAFKSFDEAIEAANKLDGCGGITQETKNGYTLRVGPEQIRTIDSKKHLGLCSWVKDV